jgi:hypothetical protein
MSGELYCELYLLRSEALEDYTLLYGYGQFHDASPRNWRLEPVAIPGRIPVSVVQATLSRPETDVLLSQFQGPSNFSLQIATPTPQTLQLQGAKRVLRPPVFRRPRMDPRAFDAAFANRLCKVVEFWNLDKGTVLSDLLYDTNSHRDEVERIRKVTRVLAERAGHDLQTRAFEALGNFELFTIQPHIYHWRQIPDDDDRARIGISIEMDLHHPDVGDRLFVAVSLENAGITVHASMQEWQRENPTALEFRAAEPFSWAEITIYGKGGELVDQGRHGFITSVAFTGSIGSGRKTVRDAWSRQVANKAGKRNAAQFEHANTVDVVSHVMPSVVEEIDPREPWQRIGRAKPPIFDIEPNPRSTYFLPKDTAKDEVTRFESIRALFDDADVARAFLVDPYFDKKALALLARVENPCPVEVVTRIKPSELTEVQALLRLKPTLITHPLTIRRAAREFHDRFLVVERGSRRDLFVVSNSYTPVGPTDPIVLTRASGLDSLRILEYIDELMADAVTYWPEPPTANRPPLTGGEHRGGSLVATILCAPSVDPRGLVATTGPALWLRTAKYFVERPPTADVELVLDYLGAHSCPSDDLGTIDADHRDAATATLQSALEAMIARFEVPYVLRHRTNLPVEAWIQVLRELSAVSDVTSPVESAIRIAAEGRARFEVHYALNIGLRLLAAWNPGAFVQLVVVPLENAIARLVNSAEASDPTMDRSVVTGALVIRELAACVRAPEILEALVAGAASPLTRRLALVALFAQYDVGRAEVARAQAAQVDAGDLAWALLVRLRDTDGLSEADRIELLAESIAQIDDSRVEAILRACQLSVAKQIADRLLLASHHSASRAFIVVHERFEAKLHTATSDHSYVGPFELEDLELATSAIRSLAKMGSIDPVVHIDAVIRKAGRRMRNFFAPRTRFLEYHSWISDLHLMQLCSLYLSKVCDGLEFSPEQQARTLRLIDELVPFLELSPQLEQRDSDNATATVRDTSISALEDALSMLHILRVRLESPA